MAKQFVELNTDLDFNGTTYVPELNGRQGDNNRDVYFFIKKGVRPFDLSDKTITLFMKDAVGGVKTASTINDRAGITAGRFSLLIPKEFYQAEGDTQESFLQIKKDDTVLTTIPLAFKVIANGMSVTQSQSTVYIDSVQKILDELAPRIEATTTGIEANQSAMKALTANIDALNQSYNFDLLGKKTQSNEWTENNIFDKDVDVKGALHATADWAKGSDYSKRSDDSDSSKHSDSSSSLDKSADINIKGITVPGGFFANSGGLWTEGNTEVRKNLLVQGNGFFNGHLMSSNHSEVMVWDNGLDARIIRVGNVVQIKVQGILITDHIAFAKLQWNIPAGFRPFGEADIIVKVGYSNGLVKIMPDGTAWNNDTEFKSSPGQNSGGDNVAYGGGTWITIDDWPV